MSQHIQKHLVDMVSIFDNRVQHALAAAGNYIYVLRVELIVRCNQLSRTLERLFNNIDLGDLIEDNPEMSPSAILSRNSIDWVVDNSDEPHVEDTFRQIGQNFPIHKNNSRYEAVYNSYRYCCCRLHWRFFFAISVFKL